MNDFISATAPIGAVPEVAAGADSAATAPAGGFAGWFDHQVGELNTQLVNAEQGVQQLAAGDAASLHDVMIRMEEAKLSFQLAVQVRSHILEAYQEVMRMQV
jgi:flagellar hook-basal body complex protein FliE